MEAAGVFVSIHGSSACVCVCALHSGWRSCRWGKGQTPVSSPQKEVTLKGYGNGRDSAALQQRTATLAKQIMLQGPKQIIMIFNLFIYFFNLLVHCQNLFGKDRESIIFFLFFELSVISSNFIWTALLVLVAQFKNNMYGDIKMFRSTSCKL